MNTVVYCCDSNGTAKPWLEHSVKTLLEHGEYDVYVISNKDPKISGTRWVDASPYIKRYGLDAISKFRYHRGSCDPMILFRMVLPFVEELRSLDKVLYIDCDTEIISDSFGKIFDISSDGSDMLGCSDFASFSKARCRKLMYIITGSDILGCSLKRMRLDGYVNSGVLMMFPKLMLKNHPMYERDLGTLLKLMVHRKLFWDQDLINLYFDIKIINPMFNSLNKSGHIDVCAALVHHIGGKKMSQYPVQYKLDNGTGLY